MDEFDYRRFSESPDIIGRIFAVAVVSGLFIFTASAFIGLLIPGFLIFAILVWMVGMILYTLYSIIRKRPVKKGAVAISAVRETKSYAPGHPSEHVVPKDYKDRVIRHNITPSSVDLKSYVMKKQNHNIFICGTAGAGKSRLNRYLLASFNGRKYIFSYKTDDEYLHIGIPILDMQKYLPDVFVDKEAFHSAFMITSPISATGIQAAQIPDILRELLEKSNSWEEFFDNIARIKATTKDKNRLAAVSFIEQKAKSLKADAIGTVQLDKSMVLDFSGLNTEAKTFYSEYILRQLWSKLQKERMKDTLICIDEVHRLLHTFDKYESIYLEMAREIRAFGMLWTATQNFTDLPDNIRSQFATQFVFNVNDVDLKVLSSIDPKLSWSAASLPVHRFTDARYPEIHYVVPEFTLYYEPVDAPQEFIKAEKHEAEEDVEAKLDYTDEVLDILSKGKSYPSEMGRTIAKKYRIDEDKAKLGIKTALSSLIKGGKITRKKMPDNVMYSISNKAVPKPDYKHDELQQKVFDILKQNSITVNKISISGEKSNPDIETDSFDIEVETGKKHSLKDLEDRIANSNKQIVIVVPDDDVAARYKGLKSSKVEITTLGILPEAIKKYLN